MQGEGFVATPWVMMIFFRYCLRYKVNEPTAKIKVLRRLVSKKKAKYIAHPKEYLQNKKIIDLRRENNENS